MTDRIFEERTMPHTHAGRSTIFEVKDNVAHALREMPSHPLPMLPIEKQNLLTLYGLTCTGMRSVGRAGGQFDWVVYARRNEDGGNLSSLRPDKLLLYHEPIETWIAEIKDWLYPRPVGPPDPVQSHLLIAPSKRRRLGR